jgi:hypothetical protein
MKMYTSELCRITKIHPENKCSGTVVYFALEYLQCVEVGCVVDVSEEYAGSVFCIEVECSCYMQWWYN